MTPLEDALSHWKRLREGMDTVILGQHAVKEQVLACLLASGHALIEGVRQRRSRMAVA